MATVPTVPATSNIQHGFAKLPPELHLKVLSHFLVIPDAEILVNEMGLQSSTDKPDYLVRFRVLLALSQTCRALRAVYLPLCWERVQWCTYSSSHVERESELGRRLKTQSEGLMTKSPHLLPLVKVVTVYLSYTLNSGSISAFTELLVNLPNLHTIRIVNGSSPQQLKKLLYGRVLPSVRSAVLPDSSSPILRFCPSVREVTCNEWVDGCGGVGLVVALIEGKCDQVEVLRRIYPDELHIKRLAKLNPPLRCIRLEARDEAADALRMYSCFPSLRTIEIDCRESNMQQGLSLVEVAKKTLKACSTYRPPKCRSARVNKEAEEVRERLAGLYPEPMMVRVRYLPDIPDWNWEHPDPSYFDPTRVEEHPV